MFSKASWRHTMRDVSHDKVWRGTNCGGWNLERLTVLWVEMSHLINFEWLWCAKIWRKGRRKVHGEVKPSSDGSELLKASYNEVSDNVHQPSTTYTRRPRRT